MCAERRRSSGETEAPMAYCVTVDIERCFDTIRPRKLYQVLKKAIREDEYLIRKHWVGQQGSATSSSKGSDKSSSFFFKMERPAFSSGDLRGFEELAAQSKKRNAMFVDGVLYDYLTKTKALQLLKEHLFANVVQIEGQVYVQKCGIPQGSVLSTTLCNIYYAHFEQRVLRKRLPEVCDPSIVPLSCCQHEELLRYTDDFLYITTDLKRARTFSEVMHHGNDEYGCSVNLAKSQVNFDPNTGSNTAGQPAVARFDAPDASGCLSWCGMLIDPVNLQIYSNYDNSALLQASIPFNETKAAQSFFVSKVVSPIRQRWHPLYFDPELLAVDTIQVNLFQMLCLAAHRFTILLEMLPFVNHDMQFFHESVHEILAKTTKGIHRSLHLGLETDTQQEPKAAPKKQRNRSSKQAYQAQKLQVSVGWMGFHGWRVLPKK
ncbi:hypothetical protein BBJ28_00012193 [Nothophytophthora sp. Chile5]|nr:hypothetical protein BBJ28_00012193 [Nothophytophthora sp. Chile5]